MKVNSINTRIYTYLKKFFYINLSFVFLVASMISCSETTDKERDSNSSDHNKKSKNQDEKLAIEQGKLDLANKKLEIEDRKLLIREKNLPTKKIIPAKKNIMPKPEPQNQNIGNTENMENKITDKDMNETLNKDIDMNGKATKEIDEIINNEINENEEDKSGAEVFNSINFNEYLDEISGSKNVKSIRDNISNYVDHISNTGDFINNKGIFKEILIKLIARLPEKTKPPKSCEGEYYGPIVKLLEFINENDKSILIESPKSYNSILKALLLHRKDNGSSTYNNSYIEKEIRKHIK